MRAWHSRGGGVNPTLLSTPIWHLPDIYLNSFLLFFAAWWTRSKIWVVAVRVEFFRRRVQFAVSEKWLTGHVSAENSSSGRDTSCASSRKVSLCSWHDFAKPHRARTRMGPIQSSQRHRSENFVIRLLLMCCVVEAERWRCEDYEHISVWLRVRRSQLLPKVC